MLKNQQNNDLYSQIRAFNADLASRVKPPFIVTPERHAEILSHYKFIIDDGVFFFTVRLLDLKISNIGGVKRWLGYDHEHFTIEKYIESIHPSMRELNVIQGNKVLQYATEGKFDFQRDNPRVNAWFALQKADGKYISVKRVTSGFQYNVHNHMWEYLNVFYIYKSYSNEAFNVNFISYPTNKTTQTLLSETKNFIHLRAYNILPFAPAEMILLREYAKNPKITEKGMAQLLSRKEAKPLSKSTIKTWKSRIKEKAQEHFGRTFKHFSQIVGLLKEENLI
jgi:hypothetical protein